MDGYDSPELHPRLAENESIKLMEKKAALNAKNFLSNLILNKIVHIKATKNDCYGRILITMYLEENENFDNTFSNSINDYMITCKMGIKYNGDKKKPFSSLLEYYKDIII